MPETPARSLTRRTIIACLTGGALIVAYLIIGNFVKELPGVEAMLANVSLRGAAFGIPILWLTIFTSLILPFSSAAFFVVLGLDLFGASSVFWTAFTAGLASTATTYVIGQHARDFIRSPRLHAAIQEAHHTLASRRVAAGVLTFALRAIPNPLYDAWGYACGIMRIPFAVYYTASIAGGAIPLALLCFGIGKLL